MNALTRKQNNHDPSRGLRRWFPSRRRRHDPWLVFNMSTFTFEGQPLHGFNRLASHDDVWRQAGFRWRSAHNKSAKIRKICRASLASATENSLLNRYAT